MALRVPLRSILLAIPLSIVMAYGAFISVFGLAGLFCQPAINVAGHVLDCFLFYVALACIYAAVCGGVHRPLLKRFSIGVFCCVWVVVFTALFSMLRHGTECKQPNHVLDGTAR